jgi:hypothetical protein
MSEKCNEIKTKLNETLKHYDASMSRYRQMPFRSEALEIKISEEIQTYGNLMNRFYKNKCDKMI